MSGGLPPRTAVSTFCSVLSLLTYRLFTVVPGFCFWYTLIRWANAFASAPVQPSQIEMDFPPPEPPLLASDPQAARPSAVTQHAAAIPSQRLLMLPLLSRSPPGRLKAMPSLVAPRSQARLSLLSPGTTAPLWLAGVLVPRSIAPQSGHSVQ